MYRRILVPLDSSEYGERALPMAISLVQQSGGQLLLVRSVGVHAMAAGDRVDAQVRAVDEAEAYLSEIKAQLERRGITSATAVACEPAAECVLLEAELREADLVVMCTHGHSGLGRWIFGSVAERVIAGSPAPVLLVRPAGETAMMGPSPERSDVLVPLDGSEFAEAALVPAQTLAAAFGGTVTLLRVVVPSLVTYSEVAVASEYGGPTMEEINANRCREAESYLADVEKGLTKAGAQVRSLVHLGWPPDVIVQQASALNTAMIVMATHGRTGVARLLMGSVALEVVRRGMTSVLLVRPSAAR